MASALRDNVHDIACALEPLLFPDGIPEELDIPVLLRALADLLERDAETPSGPKSDDRGTDGRDAGAGCRPASQRTAPTAPPSPAEPTDRIPRQSHLREESRTDAPAESIAGQPAEEAPDETDAPRQALRHALLRMRALLGSMCGPHAPRRYGLDSRVPEEPEQLLAFARRAAHLLERAEPSASRPAPFVTLDLVGAAASLRDHIEALEAQLYPHPGAAVGAEDGADERARRRWSPDVQAAASVAEGLLRLAQMDDRADLVRALRSARAGAGRRGVQQRGEARRAAGAEPPAA